MGLLSLFTRKTEPAETRSSGAGYTAEIMGARASYLADTSGIADLTATAQACVGLWEGAFTSADVTGTRYLVP